MQPSEFRLVALAIGYLLSPFPSSSMRQPVFQVRAIHFHFLQDGFGIPRDTSFQLCPLLPLYGHIPQSAELPNR